jgi:hypothetical protein
MTKQEMKQAISLTKEMVENSRHYVRGFFYGVEEFEVLKIDISDFDFQNGTLYCTFEVMTEFVEDSQDKYIEDYYEYFIPFDKLINPTVAYDAGKAYAEKEEEKQRIRKEQQLELERQQYLRLKEKFENN